MKTYLQILPATYIASQGMLADAMNRNALLFRRNVVEPVSCVVNRAQLRLSGPVGRNRCVFESLERVNMEESRNEKHDASAVCLWDHDVPCCSVFGLVRCTNFKQAPPKVICCVVISTLVSPNASKLRKSQR